MEQKYRMIIVLTIAATIIVAVFASFGIPFLSGRTSQIVLPDVTGSAAQTDAVDGSQNQSGYVPVSVTPSTVQKVIATLARPENYYRKLTVELLWQDNTTVKSAVSTVQVWTDGAYMKAAILTADGTMQYCVIANGTRYVWYGSDKTYVSTPAKEHAADLAQRIPTYEDVLSLNPALITSAGYEQKNGHDCIYVEVKEEQLGYLERYWIETATGLLVAAETEENGIVVYRMTEDTMESPVQDQVVFSLPDGTVLHTISGAS